MSAMEFVVIIGAFLFGYIGSQIVLLIYDDEIKTFLNKIDKWWYGDK